MKTSNTTINLAKDKDKESHLSEPPVDHTSRSQSNENLVLARQIHMSATLMKPHDYPKGKSRTELDAYYSPSVQFQPVDPNKERVL